MNGAEHTRPKGTQTPTRDMKVCSVTRLIVKSSALAPDTGKAAGPHARHRLLHHTWTVVLGRDRVSIRNLFPRPYITFASTHYARTFAPRRLLEIRKNTNREPFNISHHECSPNMVSTSIQQT